MLDSGGPTQFPITLPAGAPLNLNRHLDNLDSFTPVPVTFDCAPRLVVDAGDPPTSGGGKRGADLKRTCGAGQAASKKPIVDGAVKHDDL